MDIHNQMFVYISRKISLRLQVIIADREGVFLQNLSGLDFLCGVSLQDDAGKSPDFLELFVGH